MKLSTDTGIKKLNVKKALAAVFAAELFEQIKKRINKRGAYEADIALMFLHRTIKMVENYVKENEANPQKKSRKSPQKR